MCVVQPVLATAALHCCCCAGCQHMQAMLFHQPCRSPGEPCHRCQWSKQLLIHEYPPCTAGDSSAADNKTQRAVLERIITKVLDSDCPELLIDLRMSDGGQEQQCFDVFWAAVSDIIA